MKLEIGYNHSFDIRREHCRANCNEGFSILYLSDFHFNKYSRGITEKILTVIEELNPGIILLGGDYVDSKNGLVFFNHLMQAISHRENVFAVAGNHDYFFGIAAIKAIVLKNKAVWIEKDVVSFKFNGVKVRIAGNKPDAQKEQADFSILCLHHPIDIGPYQDRYDLVFAGHLHGGQFVFWQSAGGLYPGRWFYKWNRLKVGGANSRYFISKGLGDTLPIRYNCRRDVIFVEIAPNRKLIQPS